MQNILVSVYDKFGLISFLKDLERFADLRVIATTSTAAFLNENKLAASKVEDLTQFPEILAGRVKTLHPKVFAGILARPSEEDRACLSQLDIPEIDLVIVNLYPFENKLSEKLDEQAMAEYIDIGGVTLLRAAAKNWQRVAVIADPSQYDMVIQSLEMNNGKFTEELRKRLAHAAFKRTAGYDLAISAYLQSLLVVESTSGQANGKDTLPEVLQLSVYKHQDLRYGENPHQSAAWYTPINITPVNSINNKTISVPEHTLPFPPFEQLQGKELSTNNVADVYAAINILRELSKPATCIIKHNNPCGVAQDNSLQTAFGKAYKCDPVSAFGGIYGFNREVNHELASAIIENFVEIVAAPSFDKEALSVFNKKKNLRLLLIKPGVLASTLATVSNQAKQVAQLLPSLRFKELQGFGLIAEQDIEPPVEPKQFRCVTAKQPALSYSEDIAFAWSVVRHLTSNAIFVAKDGQSIGFGIGQTNRVGSVKLALSQAQESAAGAVLASDGFFPAVDNIEAAAAAGIAVIVQPGGSIKDEEVIAACNQAGIAMLFTGQRCFRH